MADADTNRSKTPRAALAGYFESCSDAFGQLGAIARAIKEESERTPFCALTITNLAGAAQHIANDLEGLSDCWRGDVLKYGVRDE